MDGEKLKKQIGANIASYRKQMGLTQAGIADCYWRVAKR